MEKPEMKNKSDVDWKYDRGCSFDKTKDCKEECPVYKPCINRRIDLITNNYQNTPPSHEEMTKVEKEIYDEYLKIQLWKSLNNS